jgi:D-beta-D-heptose 7-phosphate kinase/D-beta-D-heptose 1-phosphate adenosyltransferase
MKILVFGELCQDKFVYGSSKRLSPEAPVPVFVPEREEVNPGMAGNVVQNLKSICDCDVKLYSQKTEITKTRFVDDKSNHMFLRIDEGESNIDSFELTEQIIKEISQSDFVIVSDYDKGFLSSNDIIMIGKSAKLSIIDAKKKLSREIIDSFTFVKLNENEWKNNEELVEGFEEKLLITLGIRGCQWHGDIFSSVNPKVTMDVSGAGDTFTASFISKYYLTNNIKESIQFANQMASIVVSKRGVQTP